MSCHMRSVSVPCTKVIVSKPACHFCVTALPPHNLARLSAQVPAPPHNLILSFTMTVAKRSYGAGCDAGGDTLSADYCPGQELESPDRAPKAKKPTAAQLQKVLNKRDAEVQNLQAENKRLKAQLETGAVVSSAAAAAPKAKPVKLLPDDKALAQADKLKKKVEKQLSSACKYEKGMQYSKRPLSASVFVDKVNAQVCLRFFLRLACPNLKTVLSATLRCAVQPSRVSRLGGAGEVPPYHSALLVLE